MELFQFKGIMSYIKPKKRLGQHFLTDNNIARKITNALQVNDVQSLVEVGAGYGSGENRPEHGPRPETDGLAARECTVPPSPSLGD